MGGLEGVYVGVEKMAGHKLYVGVNENLSGFKSEEKKFWLGVTYLCRQIIDDKDGQRQLLIKTCIFDIQYCVFRDLQSAALFYIV